MPKPEPSSSPFTPAPLPVAPLTPAQRLACLRLVRTDGVGPTLFRDLINHYGGAEAALAALPGSRPPRRRLASAAHLPARPRRGGARGGRARRRAARCSRSSPAIRRTWR